MVTKLLCIDFQVRLCVTFENRCEEGSTCTAIILFVEWLWATELTWLMGPL